MSTRSTTHFRTEPDGESYAIVYRHSDGYPSGAGKDIQRFIAEVGKLADSRFGDPSYLAAKYVVFLAQMFNRTYAPGEDGKYAWRPNESPLDFLSVGVVIEDPSDIEYQYIVVSVPGFGRGKPAVYVDRLDGKPPVTLASALRAEAVAAR